MSKPAITVSENAELPKAIVAKLPKNQNTIYKGISEFSFPSDFWEYFDKNLNRQTNYPDLKPKRYGKFFGYIGFDFDSALQGVTLSYLVQQIQKGEIIYFRPSSTLKGIHLLTRDNFLADFEDQRRQDFTQVRGYEWFWLSKTTIDKPLKAAHRLTNEGFVETRYFQFNRLTLVDCFRLFNWECRQFRRKLSRKKRYRIQ